MHREVGDERARYGRRTRRDDIQDVVDWLREHPVAVLVFVLVAGLMAWSIWPKPSARFGDLAVGDCLFIPTAAISDPTNERPIGEAAVVEEVVVSGGAQQADCAASHGHEVAAIVFDVAPTLGPDEIPTRLDRDAIHRRTQPLCDAAFATYVGRDRAGSALMIFPVAPDPQDWLAGNRRTVCLVARSDGQWLDRPARGSAR